MPSKEEFVEALKEELRGYELSGKKERAEQVKKEIAALTEKKPATKKDAKTEEK